MSFLDPFVRTREEDIATIVDAIVPHLRDGDTVADLGSGDGAILKALSRLSFPMRLVGVECDSALVHATRLQFAYEIIEGDLLSLSWEHFDVMVTSITRQHCTAVIAKFETETATHARPRALVLFSGELTWAITRAPIHPHKFW